MKALIIWESKFILDLDYIHTAWKLSMVWVCLFIEKLFLTQYLYTQENICSNGTIYDFTIKHRAQKDSF